MPKNAYQNLSAKQALLLSEEEMKFFREKWSEINEPEGYVAKMAREKGTIISPLLKGDVFMQGVKTLKNLAQAHFERKKPGFFSMLFRTKEAQEYRNERKQINKLAEFLKTENNKNNQMIFLNEKGQSLLTPVNIDGLTKKNDYFKVLAKDVDSIAETTRNTLSGRLNGDDVNMQDTKDQIILNFLKECDKQPEVEFLPKDEKFTDQIDRLIKSSETVVAEQDSESIDEPELNQSKTLL